MKITFFLNVTLHSLVYHYQHFGRSCCLHLQGRKLTQLHWTWRQEVPLKCYLGRQLFLKLRIWQPHFKMTVYCNLAPPCKCRVHKKLLIPFWFSFPFFGFSMPRNLYTTSSTCGMNTVKIFGLTTWSTILSTPMSRKPDLRDEIKLWVPSFR